MSKEQLIHIFDDSVCLGRRQMRDYVNGKMTNEESHAVEVHLNACPFCNEAIEGLFEQKEGRAADMVMELEGGFLKDHLSLHNPHIHLNSMAPAANAASQPYVYKRRRKHKVKAQPFWRMSSIAAALLLICGGLWYVKYGHNTIRLNRQVAQQATIPATESSDQAMETNDALSSEAAVTTPQNSVSANPIALEEDMVAQTSTAPAPATPVADNALNTQQRIVEQEQKEETSKKREEAVTALAYKEPLVETYKAEKSVKSIAADEIEKMPSRSTRDIANTPPGTYSSQEGLKMSGARTDGTQYVIDGVQVKGKAATGNNMDRANDLYSQKKYSAALSLYNSEMSSGSKGARNQAAIMSARCHIALGNKERAAQILQSVVSDGGPQKRTAKKMLKDLGKE